MNRLLAHETHHCHRRRSVGYGETLGEAIILEGLADHFALEVFGGPPDRWCVSLDDEHLADWYAEAEKEFGAGQYDHFAWFYGRGSRRIPNWAGYSLGFDIVARYLEANLSRKPSDLDSVPADIILKDYRPTSTA